MHVDHTGKVYNIYGGYGRYYGKHRLNITEDVSAAVLFGKNLTQKAIIACVIDIRFLMSSKLLLLPFHQYVFLLRKLV